MARRTATHSHKQKLEALPEEALSTFSLASTWIPDWLCPSAWTEHAPFAFWLCEVLRPRRFVELGTHYGYSYFCFCQAIKKLRLGTTAYAVDSWLGDEHAGFYDEEVYQSVLRHNQREFSGFSHLCRSTFDSAVSLFSDGSIDLMHIDGRHFYEDVRHDFLSWRPKLTEDAVVLFHDTSEVGRGFDVVRFFEELASEHHSFRFFHEHGLGVIAVGRNMPKPLKSLFNTSREVADRIRAIYATLGTALTLRRTLAERDQQIVALDRLVAERDQQIVDLNRLVDERDVRLRAVYRSKSWRVGNKLARLFRALFPPDSTRYMIFGLLIRPILRKTYSIGRLCWHAARTLKMRRRRVPRMTGGGDPC